MRATGCSFARATFEQVRRACLIRDVVDFETVRGLANAGICAGLNQWRGDAVVVIYACVIDVGVVCIKTENVARAHCLKVPARAFVA
jgi:hypothetical protein